MISVVSDQRMADELEKLFERKTGHPLQAPQKQGLLKRAVIAGDPLVRHDLQCDVSQVADGALEDGEVEEIQQHDQVGIGHVQSLHQVGHPHAILSETLFKKRLFRSALFEPYRHRTGRRVADRRSENKKRL